MISESTSRNSWKFTFFSTLLFILFFQLTPDFIESIYTFGLLGTDIPPQIVSILFFFSPILLIVFPKKSPSQGIYVLAVLTAAARAMEVVLNPTGKMLISGFGVGCLFLLIPLLFDILFRPGDDLQVNDIGLGLLFALAMVILLRSLGEGSDISLIQPWISWVLFIALFAAIIGIWQEKDTQKPELSPSEQVSTKAVWLCIGITGCLSMIYFALMSPTVLSRWSELDYRIIVTLLAISLAVYYGLLSSGMINRLPRIWVWLWNGMFILSGVIAILIYQVEFPAESTAYPIYQTEIHFWQHIPLLVMIALCPVIIHNFILFWQELGRENPAPRTLGYGFLLGVLFFLAIMLMQVFTTVYDYIPVVGPLMRDRFWFVFLVAGLGMSLPLFAAKSKPATIQSRKYSPMLTPLIFTILAIPVIYVTYSEPTPNINEHKQTFTVLTYNLQQGYSVSGERSYEEQLELIRSQNPDIVGLQESDTARFSGGNADLVRTISHGLGMYSYYGPRTVTGTFGIALLSRYPIENPRTFFMYSAGEQTASIEASITVNNKKYWILVTHLGNDGPIIQQENVLQQLQGKQNVIAMGDFNFEPATEQYLLTTQLFADAWVLAGSPLPDTLEAEHLIDHIFVSPEVAVRSAQYIASPASDHPALVVEINK